MSHDKPPSTHGEKKKAKKKSIRERNKKHHLVNLMAWEHEGTDERQREVDAESKERKEREAQEVSRRAESEPGTEVWSAQLQKVRNKLTGKKRKSRERWNRFAGTSAAGAQGR